MEKIGKYEIREILGRGGMGVVYRAYDPLIDREVAIKVIQQSALESSETKARFIREARTAGKLTHENIMVIHDLGEIDEKTFIVMEYLPGKDLRSIIDNKEPLTLGEKLNYARQICRGLHYAHSNLIIHRDIKPENIKVLPDGRVKIMDFGIAKPYVPSDPGGEFETAQVLTRIGMRIGTPWYMSPEQVKGTRVDKRADIFSFGVVLYELLTYKKPFEGDDTTVLYKILHEEPPPIQIEESGLAASLQRILSRCLAKDPETRYSDCLLVVRDLEAIPDKVQQLLKEGKELAAKNRLEEATVKLEEILTIDPGNPEAQRTLTMLTGLGQDAATQRVLSGEIIGDMIGHFHIIEKIGDGGMGVVYKAEDVTLKRLVALKFLLPDSTRDQTAKKRFLKEAQAASALDHPNICTIHEISETEDKLIFICMAYYGGDNLNRKIARGPLDVAEALDITVRIARGLSKAHEHGIVHRDIKPANIIITNDGEVKIVDFGLAKLSGATRITRVGSTMGTLPFMSPEHIKGLDQDHRTDIWALGVLLYQILTGKLPFAGDNEASIQYSIVNADPAPPSRLRAGLPAGLDHIVARALKKDVDARYGTMKEMLGELDNVRHGIARPADADLARSAEMNRLVENATIYLQRKQYDEALSRFEAALKLSPKDPRILQLRDQCKAQQQGASRIEGLLRDAQSLLEKGKVREAEAKLKDILAVDPQHQRARDLLASAQHALAHREGIDKLLTDAAFKLRHHKPGEAAECFKKVLEIDPENKDAVRGLKKAEREIEVQEKSELARTPVPSPPAPRSNKNVLLAILAVACVGGVAAWLLLRPAGEAEKPVRTQPAVDSSAFIAGAREAMLSRKAAAVKADAARWAVAMFDSAAFLEDSAEKRRSAGRFASAKEAYELAGGVYAAAETEAARNEAAANANVTELAGLVATAKEEMRREKAAAEEAGGKKAAPRLFSDAQAREKRGENHQKAGGRQDLLAARTEYAGARDAYKGIVTEVNRRDGLRRDAEARRVEMAQSKQKVSGTDAEKKGNASYRMAVTAEEMAQRLLQSGDYEGARDAFAAAGKSFADAGNELAAARKAKTSLVEPPKPTAEQKEPEKKDPVVKEREDRETARQEIQRMVESYREYVEKGKLQELTALLSLTPDQQSGWSEFFNSSSDRKVAIEKPEIEVTRETARVVFKFRMSFFNTGANVVQPPQESTRSWTLEAHNGSWKVVTQK